MRNGGWSPVATGGGAASICSIWSDNSWKQDDREVGRLQFRLRRVNLLIRGVQVLQQLGRDRVQRRAAGNRHQVLQPHVVAASLQVV
jgi:hypothetical protein